MRTISQREFRNQSGEVMRALEAGESFLLTNNGKPVGKLTPVGEPEPELRLSRAATRRGALKVPTRKSSIPTQEILDDLRGDR